jgi:hypothetical protein
MRDFSLSSKCKALASRDGDVGVNRKDKTPARQEVGTAAPLTAIASLLLVFFTLRAD